MNWSHIIIHHTAGADTDASNVKSIRDYHVDGRGWRDIGYHFVVEQIAGHYEVVIGRPMHMQGAHAPGYNKKGLGVAFVGNFMQEPPPEEMIITGVKRIIRPLVIQFNIPVKNILGHRDTKDTDCPGAMFDMDELRGMV